MVAPDPQTKDNLIPPLMLLSLLPRLLNGALRADRLNMAVNYGIDELRFGASVRCGDAMQLSLIVKSVDQRGVAQARVTFGAVISAPTSGEPAATFDFIVLYSFRSSEGTC